VQVKNGRGAKLDVAAVDANDLRYAGAAVVEGEEQGVIAPPCAVSPVGRGEDGLDLGSSEIGNEPSIGPLDRNGQDTCDLGDRLWCSEGNEAEEGSDGGQAGVSGTSGIGALLFQVIEKREDSVGADIGENQTSRLQPAVAEESQQQSEAVSIGGDGLGADALVRGEMLDEEGLEEWPKRDHSTPPAYAANRSEAVPRSSGVAVKYQ